MSLSPKALSSSLLWPCIGIFGNSNMFGKMGVVLEKDETKAEVIEYYGKREIKIRVVGKHKRDLLTTVTYELDKIHDSYQRLKYNKLIPCNCQECKPSQEPYFYQYNQLRERIFHNRLEVECGKPPYHYSSSLILDWRSQWT